MNPIFSLILACFGLLNVLIILGLYLIMRKKKTIDVTRDVAKAVHQVVQQKLRSGLSRTIQMGEYFSWEPRRGDIRQFLAIQDGYLVLESFAGGRLTPNLYKIDREFIQVWECVHPKGFYFSHMTTKDGGIIVFDNDKKVWKLDTSTGSVVKTEIRI